MKALITALLCVLMLAASATAALAQLQSGNIAGTITDPQGAVIPGVTVTLTGSDRTSTLTTENDGRYRFINLAPGAYTVTAELPGFTRMVHEGIVVVVGSNVEIPISMRVAAVADTVTVTAVSPLVDPKAMGTATNFTQDELSKVPTSRDPWALLRSVPGVLVDRINVGGNETGQQSGYAAKGMTSTQSVWTLDGVVITDMAAVGASPTYFDFDAFDEIQISTGGNDIRQPTGGVGLNFVVKRGTNQWKGTARGYFLNDGLEAENVPEELKRPSAGGLPAVTAASADHNKQITDYGFDIGGPIARDKAWVWGSWTKQDIRLVRSSGNLIDRTILKTVNLKGNWQATSKDMFSVLWFNGSKEKFGRGTGAASFEPPSATWNQGNNSPEGRPNGLLKFQDDRVFTSNLFMSFKYAYYGTGFMLEPAGGLDGQAGISARLGQSFGTTRAARFLRPQTTVNIDGNRFLSAGGGNHDFKFGFGWRRTDSYSQTLWPGDMVVGYDNAVTDKRARLHREGAGTDRTEYVDVYFGDTISMSRLTLDLGVRYDRQGGSALPSDTQSNKAFPTIVPGISFAGYDAPFTFSNISPRAGMTYALDESNKTTFRASFARYAGQLNNGTVGYSNPSAAVGFVDYPWNDVNGDNLVQPNEVLFGQGVITFGGGFNPANPTAVTSANRIDPDLEPTRSTGVIVGIDRELRPNLALQVNFSYTRTTGYQATPWFGLTAADYVRGTDVTGTVPFAYTVPIYTPIAASVAANGNSRILTNHDGYRSEYRGVEFTLRKRMSDRWMMRFSGSFNDAVEYWDQNPPVNSIGNPTRLDTDTLAQGGQFAPRTAGSGAGDVFVNGRWQFNVNGAYQLPGGFEAAGNLFAKQGTPYPPQRTVALGLDGSNRVLVGEELDTLRLDNVASLDLRLAKNFTANRFNARIEFDVFNALNGNYAINRLRNVASPNYGRITQNLSPRVARIGIRLGF